MELIWHGPEPRQYRDPEDVIEARKPADVPAALQRAEDALAAGFSIAGYLTYDAGAATAGLNHEAFAVTEPLLALGIYKGPLPVKPSRSVSAKIGPLVAQIDRKRYDADLAAIATALFEGEVYQVNYTVPFAFRYRGNARALFEHLRHRAKVPYAAFVRHAEHALISLSPELFFEIDNERIVVKPMKGTTLPNAAQALANAKNRAEHVMIVDLMRNDLGRICSVVDVPVLFAVERYPTFASMTSTIEGILEPGRSLVDVFAALFPSGSITGAPKRSAMRSIARLERAPRSIAMGTIGFCDPQRRGIWSVAIRTAIVDERTGLGELRVGGGIVADSIPTAEWAEVLTKRRAFEAKDRPGLIETMRVRRDGIVVREGQHLARLERSAFALGIPLDIASARIVLGHAARCPRHSDALLRLTVDAEGKLETHERAIDEIPITASLCIAPQRLDENDPALRHKTTHRQRYDAALAFAREANCFEAVLLNESGAIADGARATIFVERGGLLLTSSLAQGALAGILRAELLESGRAREATLDPHDLTTGRTFIGNSARGLHQISVTSH